MRDDKQSRRAPVPPSPPVPGPLIVPFPHVIDETRQQVTVRAPAAAAEPGTTPPVSAGTPPPG